MSSAKNSQGFGTAVGRDATNVTVTRVEYHGGRESYLLSNGVAEVIVVPAIGRVMQFRMAGDPTGVFWENRALGGQLTTTGSEWANFGGDKAWPAPQEHWERVAGRAWPPPVAFDSLPVEAAVHGSELVLTSAVDPSYGIQVVRRIALDATKAKLAIATEYHKVSGAAVTAGVWVITQLRDPQRVFALLPEKVKRAPGFYQMQGPAPYDFQQHERMVSLRRDPANNLKIGAEGNSLLWVGDEYVLRIDHDSAAGSTSIYTNMYPLQYVELETEGPVMDMKAGDHIKLTNTYELTRRTTPDVVTEARRAFGLTQE